MWYNQGMWHSITEFPVSCGVSALFSSLSAAVVVAVLDVSRGVDLLGTLLRACS